jgi:hypothetical protein
VDADKWFNDQNKKQGGDNATFAHDRSCSGDCSSDPGLGPAEARQIAEKLLAMDNKAWANKSCAEEGALYVEDAIRVFPKGSLRGRAAIEKWFCGPMTAKDWVQDPSTLDQVKVADDHVILYTGGWSGTWSGPKGPVPFKERYAKTVVRDGNTWKWVMSVDNNAPQVQ